MEAWSGKIGTAGNSVMQTSPGTVPAGGPAVPTFVMTEDLLKPLEGLVSELRALGAKRERMDGTGGGDGDRGYRRQRGEHTEARQQAQRQEVCRNVKDGQPCPRLNSGRRRCFFRHPELESGVSMNDSSQGSGSGSGTVPAGAGAAGRGGDGQRRGSAASSQRPGPVGGNRSAGGREGAAPQGGGGTAFRPGIAHRGN